MRRTTVLLTFVMVVSACSGEEATTAPSTTDRVVTSHATQPTTTTLGTTTTQVEDPTTTTKPPIMGGVITRHDDGCDYEGPTEFDVNSDVTFTFINASETLNAGFAVQKVDEGTSTNKIFELGIFAVSDEETGGYEPYLPSPGNPPGSENSITVTLDRIGLHALICFQWPEGRPHYANLFTVNG